MSASAGSVQRRLELARDLRPDLEAARTDCGAEHHAQIRGTRAELRSERAHHRGQHARDRPAPAGVRGGDRAGARIDDQRRDAVGDEHAQRHAGIAGDQRVRLYTGDRRRIVAAAHAYDGRAVDLARDVERPCDADRAQQPAPVLFDAGDDVAPARAQVQRVVGHRAHPTRPRREPVRERRLDQPRAHERQVNPRAGLVAFDGPHGQAALPTWRAAMRHAQRARSGLARTCAATAAYSRSASRSRSSAVRPGRERPEQRRLRERAHPAGERRRQAPSSPLRSNAAHSGSGDVTRTCSTIWSRPASADSANGASSSPRDRKNSERRHRRLRPVTSRPRRPRRRAPPRSHRGRARRRRRLRRRRSRRRSPAVRRGEALRRAGRGNRRQSRRAWSRNGPAPGVRAVGAQA